MYVGSIQVHTADNDDMRVDQDDRNITAMVGELEETEVLKDYIHEIKLDIQNYLACNKKVETNINHSDYMEYLANDFPAQTSNKN